MDPLQPDVYLASSSSFLEDRLQGRQGLYQSGRGLRCLACLAEGAGRGGVWAPRQGLALEKQKAGCCRGCASLMKEVRVGAVTAIGRMRAGRKDGKHSLEVAGKSSGHLSGTCC